MGKKIACELLNAHQSTDCQIREPHETKLLLRVGPIRAVSAHSTVHCLALPPASAALCRATVSSQCSAVRRKPRATGTTGKRQHATARRAVLHCPAVVCNQAWHAAHLRHCSTPAQCNVRRGAAHHALQLLPPARRAATTAAALSSPKEAELYAVYSAAQPQHSDLIGANHSQIFKHSLLPQLLYLSPLFNRNCHTMIEF